MTWRQHLTHSSIGNLVFTPKLGSPSAKTVDLTSALQYINRLSSVPIEGKTSTVVLRRAILRNTSEWLNHYYYVQQAWNSKWHLKSREYTVNSQFPWESECSHAPKHFLISNLFQPIDNFIDNLQWQCYRNVWSRSDYSGLYITCVLLFM